MRGRLFLFAKFYVFWLLFFILQKVLFLTTQSSLLGDVGWLDWCRVVLHGFTLDFAVASYLVAGLSLLLIGSFFYSPNTAKRLIQCYTCCLLVVSLTIIIADLFTFPSWRFHIDKIVFFYIDNPKDVWACAQWYVWIGGITGMILLTALCLQVFNRYMNWKQTDYFSPQSMPAVLWKTTLMLVITASLFIPIRGGVFTVATTNTGQVFFSTNQLLNVAAINPIFNMFESLTTPNFDTHKYTYMSSHEADELLNQLFDHHFVGEVSPSLQPAGTQNRTSDNIIKSDTATNHLHEQSLSCQRFSATPSAGDTPATPPSNAYYPPQMQKMPTNRSDKAQNPSQPATAAYQKPNGNTSQSAAAAYQKPNGNTSKNSMSADPKPITIDPNSPPNILLFIVESLSANPMEFVSKRSDITPNLNRFARQGIFFSNAYASSFRTDRGVVSIISGFPGQPTSSLMLVPKKCSNLPYWTRDLQQMGYSLKFFYGGDENFTRMRSYLTHAGFLSRVCDQNFPISERLSKWGAHDHTLLNYVWKDLKANWTDSAPALNVVLTQSSHEPFDVPFKRLNNPYLNSLAYTDSCLGAFVDSLQSTPFWQNTLVIIVADHGFTYPNTLSNYDLPKYHIPIIMLGGVVNHPQEITKTASQIDLGATILGLFGRQYNNPFCKDLFDKQYMPFAFFAFNDGFALVTDSGHTVYDAKLKRTISDEPPCEKRTNQAKAFMQKVYETIDLL